MPYLDGLPAAATVSVNDLIAVDQGGTPNIPGTATTRKATISQFLGTIPGGTFLPLIGGTLTGPLVINSTLDVSGATALGGTLAVTGATTLHGGTFTGTFAGNHTLSGNVGIGGTLVITGVTTATGAINGNTTLTLQQSGNTTVVGGMLRAPHLNMGGASGNGLSITLSAIPDFTTSPVWINSFFGGANANTNNQFFNSLISNDNVTYTGNGISASLLVRQNSQANAKNAGGVWIETQQTQAPVNPFGFTTAITGASSLNFNCGGVALTVGNTAGAATTLNTYTSAGSGATFINGLVGYEMDIQAQAGSSMGGKTGLLIVRLPSDVVSGAFALDRAISFGASTSTAGWDYMINFGGTDHQIPYKSTATFITSGEPQTPSSGQALAAWGVDFSGVLFSSGFLKSIGYMVDGSGNTTSQKETISNWTLTPSATGLAIDAPSQRASLTSIAAGGSGWAVGDKAVTATGGVYRVTGVTGAAVTSIVQVVPDTSSSPPGNPVAATPTNTSIYHVNASGLTLNLAWTAANELSVQPTAGGTLKVGTSLMTANGIVATALTAVGPTGSHTTAQEWLTVTNAAGTVRYIPCF